MLKGLSLAFALCGALLAQAPVSVSTGPPYQAWTTVIDTQTTYIIVGKARSVQPTTTFTVTSVSKANPAVISVTAHGLQPGNKVTISGGTGDWAGLNGSLTITVVDANSFSVAVNSSAYSGTFGGTVTTTAPLTSQSVWSIQKNFLDGSGNVTLSAWADGTPATAKIWDSRTTYGYQ